MLIEFEPVILTFAKSEEVFYFANSDLAEEFADIIEIMLNDELGNEPQDDSWVMLFEGDAYEIAPIQIFDNPEIPAQKFAGKDVLEHMPDEE